MSVTRAVFQHKEAYPIGAFDGGLIPHFQINARMAQRAADAVAGDAAGRNFNDFWGIYGHGALGKGGLISKIGGIITLKI